MFPSAQEALDKLQENGNFVAIATGRAYYKAKNFLKEVGLNNMVCNGGNGLVINHQLVKMHHWIGKKHWLLLMKQKI